MADRFDEVPLEPMPHLRAEVERLSGIIANADTIINNACIPNPGVAMPCDWWQDAMRSELGRVQAALRQEG